MEPSFYRRLADDALAGAHIADDRCLQILTDPAVDLLPLLNAAYEVRHAHWGKTVQVHVLNNAQNGKCPEDCSYCSQARTSEAPIEEYSMKDDDEILDEAERAYEAGAFRYCLVMSGRGPSKRAPSSWPAWCDASSRPTPWRCASQRACSTTTRPRCWLRPGSID